MFVTTKLEEFMFRNIYKNRMQGPKILFANTGPTTFTYRYPS
jgi:hypothetical protein